MLLSIYDSYTKLMYVYGLLQNNTIFSLLIRRQSMPTQANLGNKSKILEEREREWVSWGRGLSPVLEAGVPTTEVNITCVRKCWSGLQNLVRQELYLCISLKHKLIMFSYFPRLSFKVWHSIRFRLYPLDFLLNVYFMTITMKNSLMPTLILLYSWRK